MGNTNAGEGRRKQLAVNEITAEKELFWGSPAVSDGRMVLRSSKHLYCVADCGETVAPGAMVIALSPIQNAWLKSQELGAPKAVVAVVAQPATKSGATTNAPNGLNVPCRRTLEPDTTDRCGNSDRH